MIESRRIKRTRKPHKCWGCLETIPSGSSALYVAEYGGREINDAYYCEKCDRFLTEHPDWFDPDFGIGAGEVLEARMELMRDELAQSTPV